MIIWIHVSSLTNPVLSCCFFENYTMFILHLIHVPRVSKETCSSLHITADFKRLNVLLVRFLEHSDAVRTAVKVATATLSAANVQALLSESFNNLLKCLFFLLSYMSVFLSLCINCM